MFRARRAKVGGCLCSVLPVHDVVEAIRASVAIDWTQMGAVSANMRQSIKRLLRKQGYRLDQREAVVITVIEQAEAVRRGWTEAACIEAVE